MLNSILEIKKEIEILQNKYNDKLYKYISDSFSNIIHLLKSIGFENYEPEYKLDNEIINLWLNFNNHNYYFKICELSDNDLHITLDCYKSDIVFDSFVYSPNIETDFDEIKNKLLRNILDDYQYFFRKQKLENLLK